MATTIGTSTVLAAIQWSSQRHIFRANGRSWVFYRDGTNIVWRTSTDHGSWSSAQTMRSSVSGDANRFSVYHDGTYIHYAYTDESYTGDLTFLNGAVGYRRGTTDSSGNISWTAAEQAALAQTTDYGRWQVVPVGLSGNSYYVTYGFNSGTLYGMKYGGAEAQISTITYGDYTSVCKDSSDNVYISYVRSSQGYSRKYSSSLEAEKTISSGSAPTVLTCLESSGTVWAFYYYDVAIRYRSFDGSTWSTAEILSTESNIQSAKIASYVNVG